jgi:hypothetical protein
MKKTCFVLALFGGAINYSCNNADTRYLDLSTGEHVELKEDPKSGLMVDARNGKPVRIYVDTRDRDTIWGATGKVINGRVEKAEDGQWIYEGENEYSAKGDDGDYKMKSGDESKVKIEDGEYKVKRGDYKKEVEKDGDITIKDGNKKIKIDGETGERKVKND